MCVDNVEYTLLLEHINPAKQNTKFNENSEEMTHEHNRLSTYCRKIKEGYKCIDCIALRCIANGITMQSSRGLLKKYTKI